MLVGVCPVRGGPVLIGFTDLHATVNVEPGVIVLHWDCACGDDHLTATGSVASGDPARARAGIERVRREQHQAPRPEERGSDAGAAGSASPDFGDAA